MELHIEALSRRVGRLRRNRYLRPILAASVVVVTGTITANALSAASATQRSYGERRSMAVADVDLEIGQIIDADDIELRDLPVALVPPDHVIDPIGRTVIEPIVGGEVVVARRVSESSDSGLRAAVTSTRRAISIERSSLLPPVRPGDRVDLLAAGTGARASIIARRALVIQVGSEGVTVSITENEMPSVARAILDATVILALIGEG